MKQLGDYRLDQCLEKKSWLSTWLGEQVSVRRTVLIDEWVVSDAAAREAFLADARAKAAVNHSAVGSVYEAVCDDAHCVCAREFLPGPSLENRLEEGEKLAPSTMAALLCRLADVQVYYEENHISTMPLRLHDLHLDEHGVMRMHNTAYCGMRGDAATQADIQMLGERFHEILAIGNPGATRISTLLAWMRGEHITEPLKWSQIRGYSEQIVQQLAEISESPIATAQGNRRIKRSISIPWRGIAIALAVVICIGGFLWLKSRPKKIRPPKQIEPPMAIEIPAGNYITPDQSVLPQRTFWIASHEVTIGEYAKFLDTLHVLGMEKFNHTSQPANKLTHEPTDWKAKYTAAKANATWHGFTVTLDTPIVNIDWWDAAAYCEWKHGTLPSQEQWFAALLYRNPKAPEMIAGSYQSVNFPTTDRTPIGLLDMAGSVSEWTSKQALNPANPLGEKQWVIIGASAQNPTNGALQREWSDNRNLKRPDLGFRVLYEQKP